MSSDSIYENYLKHNKYCSVKWIKYITESRQFFYSLDDEIIKWWNDHNQIFLIFCIEVSFESST